MSHRGHDFCDLSKNRAEPEPRPATTHTHTKSQDHLRHLALGLGGKFFVGQHDAAVGQVDHDQAAAFVVTEVEEGLAVIEGSTRAG